MEGYAYVFTGKKEGFPMEHKSALLHNQPLISSITRIWHQPFSALVGFALALLTFAWFHMLALAHIPASITIFALIVYYFILCIDAEKDKRKSLAICLCLYAFTGPSISAISLVAGGYWLLLTAFSVLGAIMFTSASIECYQQLRAEEVTPSAGF